ncbi:MAG: hypothetical protein GC185_05030 [Alphaproteobacteria bacterium]|nr:hypothetical protein [Alphaproteobacteria bacterium]
MKNFETWMKMLNALTNSTADVMHDKVEKDRQELLRDIEKTCAEARELMQRLDDFIAFETFRVNKAADYFNEAAKKCPESAQEYYYLAEVAKEIARTAPEKGLSNLNDEHRSIRRTSSPLLEAWRRARETYQCEIDGYVGEKLDEFIAPNPGRWERMKKAQPDLARRFRKPPGC